MGCTVGDIDNDGLPDLYVLGLNGNVLYRNRGDGAFTDATEAAGLGGGRWSTSAAFVDFDRDGDLDLYVANNIQVERGSPPVLPRAGLQLPRDPRDVRSPRPHRRARRLLPEQRGRDLHRRDGRRRGPRRASPLRAGGRGQGLRQRRLARHLRGQRLDAQLPLPEPEKRHLRGRGAPGRSGGLRRRHRAGQHRDRLRGLRQRRLARPHEEQLLVREQQPLPQRARTNFGSGEGDKRLRRGHLLPRLLGHQVPRLRQRQVEGVVVANGHVYLTCATAPPAARPTTAPASLPRPGNGKFADVSNGSRPGVREKRSSQGWPQAVSTTTATSTSSS